MKYSCTFLVLVLFLVVDGESSVKAGIADFSISSGYAMHAPFERENDNPVVDSFDPQQEINVMLHVDFDIAEDWMLLFSLGGGYGNRDLDWFFGVSIQPVLFWNDFLFFLPGVTYRGFHPDREQMFLQARQLTTGLGGGYCFWKVCVEFLFEFGDMVESLKVRPDGKKAVSSLGFGIYPRIRWPF